jgi:hypothetical protein
MAYMKHSELSAKLIVTSLPDLFEEAMSKSTAAPTPASPKSVMSLASSYAASEASSEASDTRSFSFISVRPGFRSSTRDSLKARCFEGPAEAARAAAPASKLSSAMIKLPANKVSLSSAESRWKAGLCIEKQVEDAVQRPPNGTQTSIQTSGKDACFLPLKELDELRNASTDLRYAGILRIESEFQSQLCEEKKINDAQAAQCSVEQLRASEYNANVNLNKLMVVDERLRERGDEPRWSHSYYYQSQILLG